MGERTKNRSEKRIQLRRVIEKWTEDLDASQFASRSESALHKRRANSVGGIVGGSAPLIVRYGSRDYGNCGST